MTRVGSQRHRKKKLMELFSLCTVLLDCMHLGHAHISMVQ